MSRLKTWIKCVVIVLPVVIIASLVFFRWTQEKTEIGAEQNYEMEYKEKKAAIEEVYGPNVSNIPDKTGTLSNKFRIIEGKYRERR